LIGAEGDDSCSTAVSTTPATDSGCSKSGAAYVYSRIGTSWALEAYIKAPNAGPKSNLAHTRLYFGRSVSLSGDRLAVGAFGEHSCAMSVSTTAATDNDCANSGAVYVYSRTGSSWGFEAYFKAPVVYPVTWALQLGNSNQISLTADRLVASIPNERSCSTGVSTTAATDTDCELSGAAYVYSRSGTSWAFEAYIKAPNANANDYLLFGTAVSFSGDRLAVSAPGEASCSTGVSATAATDNGCSYSGAAYVYSRTGTSWAFEAYFKAPQALNSASFGQSVSLTDDRLAIGAPYEDTCSTVVSSTVPTGMGYCLNPGAAYIYSRSGTDWAFNAYVRAPNSEAEDVFGDGLSLSGLTLAVGAAEEDGCSTAPHTGVSSTAATDNDCSGAGAAYLFDAS